MLSQKNCLVELKVISQFNFAAIIVLINFVLVHSDLLNYAKAFDTDPVALICHDMHLKTDEEKQAAGKAIQEIYGGGFQKDLWKVVKVTSLENPIDRKYESAKKSYKLFNFESFRLKIFKINKSTNCLLLNANLSETFRCGLYESFSDTWILFDPTQNTLR